MVDVKNKKVTVLGAARSGVAVAILLKKLEAVPFVSDSAAAESKPEAVKRLSEAEIEYEFGGHSERITNADFVVLSPGIPVKSEIVQSVVHRKLPLFSEIEVASWFCRSPLIAVTGSNGKTTTTTLIGEMLRQKYPRAIVAGNIGSPFSEYVLKSEKESWAVVEVSSFQLETIRHFHPDQALVLNFAPNHLNRYDSYESYLESKWLVTKNLQPQDKLIYNAADFKLSQWAAAKAATRQGFDITGDAQQAAYFDGQAIYLNDEKLIDVDQMILRGEHNYMNVMAAALAAKNAGISNNQICEVLRNFKGVEHRLEFVADKHGIKYINDSKATTVESLSYALQSFDSPIVLIAGGKDKGSDFTKLNEHISRYVKEIVLIGAATDKMERAWSGLKPIHKASSLAAAVKIATSAAAPGEVVLLSPACASFDMFSDFEDRGRQFKKMVQEL